MSSNIIKKNEIKYLQEKEARIKKELETLYAKEKSNICSFQSLQLQKEMKKVHSQLQIIMLGHNDDDNDNLA